MLSVLLALQMAAVGQNDPFAFLQPTVTITADDRKRLDRGEPIAHVLPTQDLEVAVVAIVPVHINGDRLVAWIREIDQLKRSPYVLAIHRFSNSPRLQDLDALTLDEVDLDDIRRCDSAHCGLKLSDGEIRSLQQAAAGRGPGWRSAVQERFRQLMLDRVEAYLARGRVSPDPSHATRSWSADAFARLVMHSDFLTAHAPQFADSLRATRPAPDIESFLYWSKERLARKAVVSITDVNIVRGRDPRDPDALIGGKEIFATHYLNASLGLTALLAGRGGAHYLVYVNRSDVDALGGLFAGLTRFVIQRRLRADSIDVLERLRRRLESGGPPSD
jgi:hypothetical protein